MADFEGASVAEIAADLPAVVHRFRSACTRAFTFGDGRPEAVVLTYDEFEDLGGERRIRRRRQILESSEVAADLANMITEIRAGTYRPVVWTDGDEPELMIMSIGQYRDLCREDALPRSRRSDARGVRAEDADP